MEGIFDFLELIGTALTSTIDFVVSMVMDIVYVVQLGVQFLATIPSYFAWMPAPMLTLVVTILTVMIIYKVAGR